MDLLLHEMEDVMNLTAVVGLLWVIVGNAPGGRVLSVAFVDLHQEDQSH